MMEKKDTIIENNSFPESVNDVANSQESINNMNVINSMLSKDEVGTIISNQMISDRFYGGASNLSTNMLDEMTLYLIQNRSGHVHVEDYTSQSHMLHILEKEYLLNKPDYLKNNFKTDLYNEEIIYVNTLKTKNFNFERYDASTNTISYEQTPGTDIEIYKVLKPEIYSISEKSNPSAFFRNDRTIVHNIGSNTSGEPSTHITSNNSNLSFFFDMPANIYNWYIGLGLPYQLLYGAIVIIIVYGTYNVIFPSKHVVGIDNIPTTNEIDNIPVIIDITVDPLYYDILYNPLYEIFVSNNAYFIQWIVAFSIYYLLLLLVMILI